MSTTSGLGVGPYVIPLELYAQNRYKLVSRMTAQLKAESLPPTGIVLLQGGSEQLRYCTDHLLLFRQESYFAYLFGVKEPDCYGAIDISTGKSLLFIPRLSEEYAVWLGKIHPPSHFKELYGVDAVHYVDEMSHILGQLKGNGVKEERPVLYVLYGLNTDSGSFSKPATFPTIETFPVNDQILHPVLSECRAHKSELEIDVIRYTNKVSSAAHVKVMKAASPGMKEYQLESIFQHEVYFEGGCRHCSYSCICATGENSAVLHYGHAAAPNDRTLEDGDMALLDMGAEYQFFGSDITCSFPINGRFTDDQRVVYGAVLSAQKAVIAKMKPGVSWVEMHKLAEEKILETLKEAGFLNGDVGEMMEKRLGAIFMPHGLGHFMGLDTHDPSGYPKGTERINEPGLRSLRTVRTLEEGMVITVEPGCYFIDPLLLPAIEDPAISKFFVTEAIQRLRTFGGVRLEDDVVVTADGCENLTKCPREIADVEAVMAGAMWPPTESGK
ncbi:unnamed protein product [Calypogeia fissa]